MPNKSVAVLLEAGHRRRLVNAAAVNNPAKVDAAELVSRRAE
jgi:hypothetical protein